MSVDAKRARAEALRGQLSALRSATAEANSVQHELVVESQLDDEITRLERETRREMETLDRATGDGSASAAIAAMTAAATSDIPEEELVPVDPTELAENKPDQIADLELPSDAPVDAGVPAESLVEGNENIEGK